MMEKEIELLNQLREPVDRAEYQNWHLSKLITDGEGLKRNCHLCDQPGLGLTYICERGDCQWLLHKSCAEKPLTPSFTHDLLKERHHIIFVQELDNQERVICSFCEELVSGSAYKCLYPGCKFVIHQSCIEIPKFLSNHPVDPIHLLVLDASLKQQHCDVCGRLCNFSYHCFVCDFAIHIKCASRGLMSVDKCHPHEFIVIPRGKVQQTCEACCQQNSEIFYLCKNCQLWIHQTCFRIYPHTIKTKECTHFLTYTFFRRDEHMCRLCKELVDKRYAAYFCDSCGYVAHLLCAYAIMESSDATLLAEDKTTSLQEIENHFSHPEHKLVLDKEDPKYDQRCMGCMDRIVYPPFYGCAACEFFLHVRCAELPRKIKEPFNEQLTITLLPKMSSTGQRCLYCQRTCTGFVYCSDELSFLILDVQCSLLQRQLKHDAHQHRLFYEEVANRDGVFLESAMRNCNGCNSKQGRYFRCASCVFCVCCRCVTYPLQISHRDHEHSLNLTYKIEDDSEEYYCLICEKKMDHSYWFYYCTKCDFTAHLDCAYSRT